jgi:hypothetical protein
MLYPLSYRGKKIILTNSTHLPKSSMNHKKLGEKKWIGRKRHKAILVFSFAFFISNKWGLDYSATGRMPLYTRTPESVRKMVFAGRPIFSEISFTVSGVLLLARNTRKTASTSVVCGAM